MRRGTARGGEKRAGGASHSSTTKTCRVHERSEEREHRGTHSAFISTVNFTFARTKNWKSSCFTNVKSL